ncbi:hypothetical protein FGW37_08460 [Streptomyces rectiverticillatus]|uniref:hypothetical protein n=1 Tax=Streptomyces rectiverticillatus TaxID=173860 RepID=UPI0015C38EFB|nr:hypothetical protein [Streptomyces rectiverticillatus]QLE71629.1 hypothetical protein FGW37_08460 [Streptomyces rectiverticillatus]
MYGKPALGSVLPMAGLTAAPEVLPGIPIARGLQEAAGAGFLLYCASAFVIIAVKLWFAVRATTMDHSPGGRP